MELRSYQVSGIEFLTSKHRAILGDAPGVGKTIQAIIALQELGAKNVLIVCPKSVIHHWENHLESWGPLNATVTNYEQVRIKIESFIEKHSDAIVFDEAHRLKNRKAKTTKAMQRFDAPIMFMLTGTPIMNRPDELWSLLHLIDSKRWRSYWKWVRLYCETDVVRFSGHPIEMVGKVKEFMIDALREELSHVMLRRELMDVLPEMPQVTETTLEVDLTSAERRVYDQMRKAYFADFPDGQVIARNDVSKLTRLRQIANSWEILGAEETSSKFKTLYELLDDLAPEQVVVFSCFAEVIKRIEGAALIHGGIDGESRKQILEAFRRKEIRTLAGTIGAMGEGVDLQSARYAVFLDRDWTPSRNAQAVARIHRYGQHFPVTVYQLVAKNTVDGYIAKVLANKQSVIDSIIEKGPNEIL